MHPDTVPCLQELAEEFDQVGDDRDHSSDGSIGDQAHQDRSSNHNRDDVSGSNTPQSDSDNEPDIRAIDVDKSGPWRNGFTMQAGVDLIVSRCRSGVEDRLVEVIYNRKHWYKSDGWAEGDYTGSNAHNEHAHFGAKADTGKLENDRRPWGIAAKWGDGDDMYPLHKGDTKQDVGYHQYLLKELGFDPGEVDNNYGDKTEDAVNAFRASHGAAADPAISAWTGKTMLIDLMSKKAGKPGKDGAPGAPGKDGAPGADGELTGSFTITGGTLQAVDQG